METHCFPVNDLPGSTKLFSAYLHEFPRVAQFYAHPPDLKSAAAYAQTFQFPPEVRRSTAEILRKQNARWGSDSSVARSLDALAQGASAVVTGQQTGLLTGPAYSIYKALTAIRTAEKLTAMGVRSVPIFWMATEDHDFDEVARVHWLHAEGMEEFLLDADPANDGRSVGEITLGKAAQSIAIRASETLMGPDAEAVSAMVADAIRPGETFASAFGKLLAGVFRDHGLILVDPSAPELHRLAVPAFQRAIADGEKLTAKLLQRGKQLERGGFAVQVKVTDSSTPLFLAVEGKRFPVRLRNGNLVAGTSVFSREELTEHAVQYPERFSGNALFRPVIQDTLLPTIAYVAGPAEIAYYAQSEVLYREVLGRMPVILPRASFTLIEPHVSRLLKKYGLGVREVTVSPAQLRARLAKLSLSASLAKRFTKEEKALLAAMRGLRGPLKKLDKTLSGAADTAERKMLYQLRKLQDKAGRASAFRFGVVERHAAILSRSLFPNRQPQERGLCFLPFLARHGNELIARLKEKADALGQHQVISLS